MTEINTKVNVLSFFVCLYSGWNFGGFIKTIAEKVNLFVHSWSNLHLFCTNLHLSMESAGSPWNSSGKQITNSVDHVDINLNYLNKWFNKSASISLNGSSLKTHDMVVLHSQEGSYKHTNMTWRSLESDWRRKLRQSQESQPTLSKTFLYP